MISAPLGKKLPNPVAEWSGPLRRSARLIEKSKPSSPAPHAGSSRKPGLQGVATTSREKGKGALPAVQGGTDDGQAQIDADVQLKHARPKRVIRSADDPILKELTGTVVVKASWPGIDRRDNEANMYRDSAGRFGTIPHVCSYEVVDEQREVISNILFLPGEENIEEYHWPIFSRTAPEKLDIRTFRLNVFSVEGKLLTEARSPQQLSRGMGHFLLGWLLTYLSGHLHRDISLGNTLMTDDPVKRKKFEIPEEFLKHLESLQDQKAVEAIKELCKEVEDLVGKLGISDQCTAFVTDGDLAISWREYWTKERETTKSGTPEFMARALITAKKNHLHSPVDDLESCFWVLVWSVLFNEDNIGSQSDDEKEVKEKLAKYYFKEVAMSMFSVLPDDGKYSNITQRFRPMLRDWWLKVRDQDVRWSQEVLTGVPKDADGGYYLPHFHRFALQGVVDVLQVLTKYWDGEVGWESWTAPTSSM